jgi:hypothetical protein
MRRTLTPIAVVAVLTTALAFAPGAGAAKVLSIGKATKVAQKVAERDCEDDPTCDTSNAANCQREAPRRVRCIASIVGDDAEGSYQCDRMVLVRLKSGGGTKHAAGKPSCYRV